MGDVGGVIGLDLLGGEVVFFLVEELGRVRISGELDLSDVVYEYGKCVFDDEEILLVFYRFVCEVKNVVG